MGVWLEEIVTKRAQLKSREKYLQEASGIGESEERIDAYEEFFLFLKATICAADDMGKGCHHINQARSMAMELLGW